MWVVRASWIRLRFKANKKLTRIVADCASQRNEQVRTRKLTSEEWIKLRFKANKKLKRIVAEDCVVGGSSPAVAGKLVVAGARLLAPGAQATCSESSTFRRKIDLSST